MSDGEERALSASSWTLCVFQFCSSHVKQHHHHHPPSSQKYHVLSCFSLFPMCYTAFRATAFQGRLGGVHDPDSAGRMHLPPEASHYQIPR